MHITKAGRIRMQLSQHFVPAECPKLPFKKPNASRDCPITDYYFTGTKCYKCKQEFTPEQIEAAKKKQREYSDDFERLYNAKYSDDVIVIDTEEKLLQHFGGVSLTTELPPYLARFYQSE